MSKKEENPFEAFNLLNSDIIVSEEDAEIKEVPDMEAVETKEKEPVTDSKKEITSPLKELEIQNVESIEDIEEEKEEEEETIIPEVKLEEAPADEAPESDHEEEESPIRVFADYLHDKGIVELKEDDFEDSDEGLVSLIENSIKNKVSEYKETLPPVAKEFLDYIDSGGEPANFIDTYSEVDYSKITGEAIEDKLEAQKQIVADLLYREGYSGEEIQEEIQDYEDGGLLYNKSKRALKKLQVHQDKQKANLVQEQKAEEVRKKEEYTNYLVSLKDDINKRENIAGFEITDRQKKKFYDYITKVDRKTGRTQLLEDSINDNDAQLKMAWLYFNKFDFDKVQRQAKTDAVSDLKSKLQRAQSSSSKMASKKRSKAPEETTSDFSLFRSIVK